MRVTLLGVADLRIGEGPLRLSDRRGDWYVESRSGEGTVFVRRMSRAERTLLLLHALNVALAVALPVHWPNAILAVLFLAVYAVMRRP